MVTLGVLRMEWGPCRVPGVGGKILFLDVGDGYKGWTFAL